MQVDGITCARCGSLRNHFAVYGLHKCAESTEWRVKSNSILSLGELRNLQINCWPGEWAARRDGKMVWIVGESVEPTHNRNLATHLRPSSRKNWVCDEPDHFLLLLFLLQSIACVWFLVACVSHFRIESHFRFFFYLFLRHPTLITHSFPHQLTLSNYIFQVT